MNIYDSIKYSVLSTILMAIIISFSGYLFINYNGNKLILNFNVRAFVLIFILIYIIAILIIDNFNCIKIPTISFFFFLPIIYMAIVSIFFIPPNVFLSSFVRWTTYALVGLFFYNNVNYEYKFKAFIWLMSLFFIMQGLYDIIAERGIFINNAFRIGGSVGSAIGYAGTLFVTGFCSFYLWLSDRKYISFLLFTILCGVIIIFTGTRSISAAYIILLPIYYFLQTGNITKKALFLLICLPALFFIVIYIFSYTDVGTRFLISNIDSDSSTKFRFFIMSTIFEQFYDTKQITGVGLGGFPFWFEGTTGRSGISPHIELLWLYVEGGIIGISIYIFCFIYITFYIFIKSSKFNVNKTFFWFFIFIILCHQGVMQFANPTYFYQLMFPLSASVGYALRVLSIYQRAALIARSRVTP